MHALIQYWAASIALAPASERISWCQGCLSLTDSEGVCRSSALRHTFLGWQLWIQTLQAVTNLAPSPKPTLNRPRLRAARSNSPESRRRRCSVAYFGIFFAGIRGSFRGAWSSSEQLSSSLRSPRCIFVSRRQERWQRAGFGGSCTSESPASILLAKRFKPWPPWP